MSRMIQVPVEAIERHVQRSSYYQPFVGEAPYAVTFCGKLYKGISTAALVEAILADYAPVETEPAADHRAIIPQTYGEFDGQYDFILPCEPHEWDNRTSAENFAWLIDKLRELDSIRQCYEQAYDDVPDDVEGDSLSERIRAMTRRMQSAICPHIVTSSEGTSYCRLAETTAGRIGELQAENQRLKSALMNSHLCRWKEDSTEKGGDANGKTSNVRRKA